jgi:iron complex transport system ATP-binding protein
MSASMTLPAANRADPAHAPLLVCRGVDLRYGARWLVRALDLEVRAGQRWALVGPNGAGKTSLLHVLAGARAADGGSVELGGQALARASVERLAALRAFVADRWVDPFAATALDTVIAARFRLGGDGLRGAVRGDPRRDPQALEVAKDCLAQMDCAHLADCDVRRLSRGERQRVAIAAALAQQSELVLLDEPISHQDPRHQLRVLERLAAYPDTSFIAAMHDINAAARFATHALLLTGESDWHAGASGTVLTCDALSRLFATEIAQIDLGTHRVFVSTSASRD